MALVILAAFLIAGCNEETFYLSNVPNQDIQLQLQRFNIAYYNEASNPEAQSNTHYHKDDHCHDQQDTCTTSNPDIKYYHCVFINVSLLTQNDDGVEKHVGIADTDQIIAEVTRSACTANKTQYLTVTLENG